MFPMTQVNATLATSEIRMRAQQKEINLRYFRDETVRCSCSSLKAEGINSVINGAKKKKTINI